MLTLQKIPFRNWNNCLCLANESAELIVSTELGPRIISYRSRQGENFFRVFEDDFANPDRSEWLSFGGHRLWMTPEEFPRTYYPDFDPVKYDFDGSTLHLVCETESTTKLQKEFFITLDEKTSHVRIVHKVHNRGGREAEFAAWGLSVMAPGGKVIVPQEPYVPHGKGPGESFVFARPLVLWQFTRMNDPRFYWGENFITMREDSRYPSKQKFGVYNTLGYALYSRKNEIFVKHFPCLKGETYPDNGCNCEFFTMPGMLEIESLSPVRSVAPGNCITHEEEWDIFECTLADDEKEMEKQLSAFQLAR